MALDEALLEHRLIPTLRFYTWKQPTISLGRFQNQAVAERLRRLAPGCEMVERRTGGKAILHDQELTYALCAPETGALVGGPAKAMLAIHSALAAELNRQTGLDICLRGRDSASSDVTDSLWCFEDSSPYDLMLKGEKLLGSAARRTAGWVLFHGSLVIHPPQQTPHIAGLGQTPNQVALADALGQALDLDFQPGPWQALEYVSIPCSAELA